MPIVREWGVFEDCKILVWQIAENIETLKQEIVVTLEEWQEYATISHPQKQLEWLTGRRAMQALVQNQGLQYEGMVKDEYGKPHLRNRVAEISLTHTLRYVVASLSLSAPLGVDLERVAPKLLRVAPKFLSEEEEKYALTDFRRLCTYWCAKEAIYKLYGTKQLSFKQEIFIHDFTDQTEFGEGYICHRNQSQRYYYRLHRFEMEDFVGVLAV